MKKRIFRGLRTLLFVLLAAASLQLDLVAPAV